MKVIFLDFDGVLNSTGSFILEGRKGTQRKHEVLCAVSTSNLQYILEHVPDAKIVISSTWRIMYQLDWLKEKLQFHRVDASRVIGITPRLDTQRGKEIAQWLEENKELNIEQFVILDDDSDMLHLKDHLVQTSFTNGLTFDKVREVLKKFGIEDKTIAI